MIMTRRISNLPKYSFKYYIHLTLTALYDRNIIMKKIYCAVVHSMHILFANVLTAWTGKSHSAVASPKAVATYSQILMLLYYGTANMLLMCHNSVLYCVFSSILFFRPQEFMKQRKH